ncbi:MAG: hypothetical protein LQ347_002248 [Umbilicaria vellea]|nr:MAG: hypothetical protein LQ347_002248 [Umbilicaria vellea]
MVSNGDYGPWKSALTEAILAKRPENAALLLEHHADPNGFPIHLFSSFSSCFVRHRPVDLRPDTIGPLPHREKILANIESAQTGPLTVSEIEARQSSQCRFWAEKDFPSLGFAFKGPITALEAAAKVGDKENCARLVKAGADTTAWITGPHVEIPAAVSPSFLTLSTPLHRAIEAENSAMVAFLLSSHHSPDYFPLSTITRSLNAAIHICEAVGSDAKDLSTLAPTALGHTVLHIACLPRDDSCINVHSRKIYESVHEVRTLSDTWQPLKLWSYAAPPPSIPTSAHTISDNTAQSSLIRHLLKTHYPSPLAALAAQDIHGNTPLHYLASARDFNEELWMWICGMIKRWRKAEAASAPQQQQQPHEATLTASRGAETQGRENTAASGYDPLIGDRKSLALQPGGFLSRQYSGAEGVGEGPDAVLAGCGGRCGLWIGWRWVGTQVGEEG